MLKELRKESSKDNNYLQALEEVRGGWAKKGKSYKRYLRRLYTQRENITVKDNLLMCENRVVIPDNMKTKLLNRIHRGHQSAGKCKERARKSVWWPQINKDITEWIKNCNICIMNSRTKHYPLITSDLPKEPKPSCNSSAVSDLLVCRVLQIFTTGCSSVAWSRATGSFAYISPICCNSASIPALLGSPSRLSIAAHCVQSRQGICQLNPFAFPCSLPALCFN